jgi:MFS family permease
LLPAVADELGEGAHVLGLVTAFYSLGGGLVAAVLHRLAKGRPRLRLLMPAIFGCAFSMLIIGLLGGLLGGLGRQIAVVALLVPIGLGLALAQAVLSTTLQLSSSAAMEGRMLSLYAAVVSVIAPIGGITLALISQATSVWVSVTISGILLTVVAIAMAVIKPAELATAGGPGELATVRRHVLQLSRYAVGFVHPGQFRPHTEAADHTDVGAVETRPSPSSS